MMVVAISICGREVTWRLPQDVRVRDLLAQRPALQPSGRWRLWAGGT
jgi:hypothetical protein